MPNVRGLVVGRALLVPTRRRCRRRHRARRRDRARPIARNAIERQYRRRRMKLTTAQAIVKYLIAQRTTIDGVEAPLFPGVFAIFGHGNVTCLGHALEEARDELPTWRGQNEQGMALAAVGFAKAMRRRQIMVATSSIGPGATQHGHRRRRRPRQPAAAAAARRATRSRAGSPIRCSSRSSTSTTRRSRSTTRSSRSPATGTGSPAPSSSCARCRTRWRRCSTRRTAGPCSWRCRRTCRPRRSSSPTSFFDVDGARDRAAAARPAPAATRRRA